MALAAQERFCRAPARWAKDSAVSCAIEAGIPAAINLLASWSELKKRITSMNLGVNPRSPFAANFLHEKANRLACLDSGDRHFAKRLFERRSRRAADNHDDDHDPNNGGLTGASHANHSHSACSVIGQNRYRPGVGWKASAAETRSAKGHGHWWLLKLRGSLMVVSCCDPSLLNRHEYSCPLPQRS
jgi:hypothetical protein